RRLIGAPTGAKQRGPGTLANRFRGRGFVGSFSRGARGPDAWIGLRARLSGIVGSRLCLAATLALGMLADVGVRVPGTGYCRQVASFSRMVVDGHGWLGVDRLGGGLVLAGHCSGNHLWM